MELKEIYVILANGISDIGKGWLTSAIGALDPENTLPIKIDPLLNYCFPPHLGVEIAEVCDENDVHDFIAESSLTKHYKVSEDLQLYSEVGMKVYPECNIVAGSLIYRYLHNSINSPKFIRDKEYKKLTFNDLSFYLAEIIAKIVKKRNPRRLLIEIGGTIDDNEMIYIPAAMRFLANADLLGVKPELVFLSYFDFAETENGVYNIKTQHVRHGITSLSKEYYGLFLRACFVRRRNVPNTIRDSVLEADLKNVSYETQIETKSIHLLPNIDKKDLKILTKLIHNMGIFPVQNEEYFLTKEVRNSKPILISACLLSIPCTHDGKIHECQIDLKYANDQGLRLIPVCPEQLGGLPTPRKPSEIQFGDGNDVLNGLSKIITEEDEDKTQCFIRGAKATLNIARVCRVSEMITQKRSPSCSCKEIFDGSFSHTKKEGVGITAAYLLNNGIKLIDIDDINKYFGNDNNR